MRDPLRRTLYVWCALLLIVPGMALSFSCGFLERNYYIYCADNVCSQGYSVADARAYSICGKLQTIRDIEPWMLKAAEYELARGPKYAGPWIYQLRYTFYVSRQSWPKDQAEYTRIYDGEPKFPTQRPHLSIVDVSPSLAELMNMRKRDEGAAERQRWKDRAVQVVDWSTLIVVLLLLSWSVKVYTDLVLAGKTAGRRAPILVQVLIFAVGSYILFATWYGALFSLAAFAIPFIWLYQLGLLAHKRVGRPEPQPFAKSTSL